MNEYEICAECTHDTKRPIGFWSRENGSSGLLYTCENMDCPIAQRRKATEEKCIHHREKVREANQRESVDAKLFRDMRRKAGVFLYEAAGRVGIQAVEMSAYEAERKPFPPEIYKELMKKFSEKAWEGVDAPIGSPEWNAAAGKIDTINNICEAVNDMNTCSRSDGNKAKKPVWKVKQSVVHTDYADGTANTKTIQRASWCCPVCDWFVGEQVEIFGRKHNQQKKNFCDRCGQKIDWESVEKEAHP